MPYMPTNISPNHVTISKDEDITFHFLVDKNDTITGVKLTLYNYYNKNDSAFIELGINEKNQTVAVASQGLQWDNGINSSTLPFVGANHEVPVFALNILTAQSDFFKTKMNTVGYTLQISNKQDYSTFVLDGTIQNNVIKKPLKDKEEYCCDFWCPVTSKLDDDKQVLINANRESYPFVQMGKAFTENNIIDSFATSDSSTNYQKLYLQNNPPADMFASMIYDINTSLPSTAWQVTHKENVNGYKQAYEFLQKCLPELQFKNLQFADNIIAFELTEESINSYQDIVYTATISDIKNFQTKEPITIKLVCQNLNTHDTQLGFELQATGSQVDFTNSEGKSYSLYLNYKLSYDKDTYISQWSDLRWSSTNKLKKHTGVIEQFNVIVGNNEYSSVGGIQYDSTKKQFYLQIDKPLSKAALSQPVTIASTFVTLRTSPDITDRIQYSLSSPFDNSNHPLKGFEPRFLSMTEYGYTRYYIGLYHSNNKILNLSDVNKYTYYYKLLDGNQMTLSSIWGFNETDKGNREGCTYRFNDRLEYTQFQRDDGSILCELPTNSGQTQGKYFQIKTNELSTSEQTFNIISSKPSIEVILKRGSGAYKVFESALTNNSNNIEYSQWTLKDSSTNEIIYQTPKEYFTIKDFEYYFFKPNKIYLLELKVHDKRNFDYSSQIEVNTEEENFEEVLLEESAKIQDKYVEIDLKDTLSENIMNRIILRDEIDNDGSIIKSILLKENVDSYNTYFRDYGAGQGKNYVYKIIVLSQPSEGSASGQIYKTNEVNTNDWYEVNLFGTKSHYKNAENGQYEIDEKNLWSFELDADANNITFNASNTPNAESAFRYPKITTSQKNYLSGSGTAYLGSLNQNGEYCKDTDKHLMDFANFASNGCVKILKLKNGMVIPVSINLKSSQNFANLNGNPTKITFDWVQVDSLDSSVTKGGEE